MDRRKEEEKVWLAVRQQKPQILLVQEHLDHRICAVSFELGRFYDFEKFYHTHQYKTNRHILLFLKYGNGQSPNDDKESGNVKTIFHKGRQIQYMKRCKSQENNFLLNWFTISCCRTRMLILSDNYEINIVLYKKFLVFIHTMNVTVILQ